MRRRFEKNGAHIEIPCRIVVSCGIQAAFGTIRLTACRRDDFSGFEARNLRAAARVVPRSA